MCLVLSADLRRSITPQPLSFGSHRSSTMRSGSSSNAFSKPSSPSCALLTRYPFWVRYKAYNSRSSSESSTIRICVCRSIHLIFRSAVEFALEGSLPQRFEHNCDWDLPAIHRLPDMAKIEELHATFADFHPLSQASNSLAFRLIRSRSSSYPERNAGCASM